MAINPTHRKTFSDRYALLHEQQVLDYLSQRRAPVPKVILSHLEQYYLEMSDGGVDLQVWIRDSGASSTQVAQALSLAIRAAIQVAELGVWHVDIALRNFVVQGMDCGGAPTVWLIDFANAISDQFPLQKPLWMLPAPHQHPQLQRSLTLDWQAFYARHALPPPADWHQAFDVPLSLYREDWTSGLQIERIQNRWCILAHGIGHMGLLMQEEMPQAFALPAPAWPGLMNLDDDARARQRLEEAFRELEAAYGAGVSSTSTPRPRASTEMPPSPSSPVALVQPVNATEPTAPAPRTTPIQAQVPFIIARPARRRVAQILNLCLITLGWLMVDAVYTRLGIVLSWLSWLAVLGALLGPALGGLLALTSQRRAGWALALLSQLAAQTMMLLELWALRAPLLTLGAIGGCLAISGSVSLLLAIFKPKAEASAAR
jgi:hypothetical protein